MKKLLLVLIAVFGVLPLFAKGYADYLAEAKKYETQKKWVYALGSYYDALETDEAPENKKEACEGYAKLRDAILAGKPGFSSYDEFTVNDEWKKLVIDAEKYFSSVCRADIEEVALVKDSVQLDFQTKTKTLTYGVKIKYKENGHRYKTLMPIVKQGLKTMIDFYSNKYSNFKAFDGANDWPECSVSYKSNKVYNANGALVYEKYKDYYNAFYDRESYGLYDFLVNVVDESGKELVKGRRWLLGTSDSAENGTYQLVFSGVSPAAADLIDSGKARANVAACYLAYGKYNEAFDKGGRSFVNNLPEVQISMDKCVVEKTLAVYDLNCFVNGILFDKAGFSDNFVTFSVVYHFQILKTEVTQKLYQMVMGENPSKNKDANNPVEMVSWYDAVCFCNKLSQIFGYDSVYSVNGETDVEKWDYAQSDVVQNQWANGFRLPTKEEWEFAAKGEQGFGYSVSDTGSDNLDDVGWYNGNSGDKTHPVAQKRPNGYGLYDMSGNVGEWVWGDNYGSENRDYCGGNYKSNAEHCEGSYRTNGYGLPAYYRSSTLGFRVARTQ